MKSLTITKSKALLPCVLQVKKERHREGKVTCWGWLQERHERMTQKDSCDAQGCEFNNLQGNCRQEQQHTVGEQEVVGNQKSNFIILFSAKHWGKSFCLTGPPFSCLGNGDNISMGCCKAMCKVPIRGPGLWKILSPPSLSLSVCPCHEDQISSRNSTLEPKVNMKWHHEDKRMCVWFGSDVL